MRNVRAIVWVLSGVASVALLVQPVSVQAQLSLSITTIVALILIWNFGRGKIARQLFLTLASFIVIRYFYWRCMYTLPPATNPIGLTLGLILFAAETYCFVVLFVSLVIGADPVKREPVKRPRDEDLPVVDVFIPTYNEDETILAATIAAARSQDYPADKYNVYVLDDGGTDQKCNDKNEIKAEAARLRRATLQSLAAQMGAFYLTRERNEHAKAGNLNNGLEHSTGELVAVLDADHAPFRTFLLETAPHFLLDEKLFLAQTPHIFLNPDPIEKNLRTFARMPSENEMFYALTQRGLDKWDASFFCGSAALLRRSALREAGGFSGVTITEDCETAFELHSRGWHSIFVSTPLIVGLQPESFSSFIGQRIRWCQGMMQILILKNPINKKGLASVQKLGYLSSMSFWLFPFPRLIFMLAPLSYILFNVKIFVCNVDEAVAYTTTYMIVNAMLQNYLYGSLRWPLMSELYEYCQGVFLFNAIISVVANPRKPTFNVTAKGITMDTEHLSELAWPFFAMFGVLAFTCVVAAYRYAVEPGAADLMRIVGIWNAFNLVIAAVGLGAVSERSQLDRHPRLTISRPAILEIPGKEFDCVVENVSISGCALRFSEPLPRFLLENEFLRRAADDRSRRRQGRRPQPAGKGAARTQKRRKRLRLQFRRHDAAGIFRARRPDVWRARSARKVPRETSRSQRPFRRRFRVRRLGDDRALARLRLSARRKKGCARSRKRASDAERPDRGAARPRRARRAKEDATRIAQDKDAGSQSGFRRTRRHRRAGRKVAAPAAFGERAQIRAEARRRRPGSGLMTKFLAPNPSLLLRAMLAAAGVVGFAASPHAQSIFLSAPPSLTGVRGPLAPPPPPTLEKVEAVQEKPPAEPVAKPSTVETRPVDRTAVDALPPGMSLRRLSHNTQGYRLKGEIGSLEWPLYLTAAQARSPLQFRVGYVSAASVMPEASTLRLAINDEEIGRTPITAFGGPQGVTFDIPPGLMREGFNSVQIGANQRHRVDCSVKATTELWTQIDPRLTGLISSESNSRLLNLADLGAAPPDEQGVLPIRVVLTDGAQPTEISRALRAVQAVSLAGRFEQPIIDMGPLAGGAYGLNLVIGEAGLARGQLGEQALGRIDGPRALMLPATPERRATVVLTGASPKDVEEAIREILASNLARGAPAGVRAAAAFPGYHVEGGQRVKLKDLGVKSQEFSGRLFRAAFNIVMPPDFYPADYGRATLRLGGGYAPGLAAGAQVVVNVEGRTAVSLSLPNSSGEVFKDNPLPLPLGFFRPGLNRVEIEAQTPTASDEDCDPLTAINAANRFLMLGDTEIEIPAIARIARVPDLAVMATGGFPYAEYAARPKLYLPSMDQRSIGTALTLGAHMAIAAGRPIDFSVSARPPASGEGPTLAVAPLDALDSEVLKALEIPAAKLRETWTSAGRSAKLSQSDEKMLASATRSRDWLAPEFDIPSACQAALPPELRRSTLTRLRFPNVDFVAVGTIARKGGEDGKDKADDPGEPDLFAEWDDKIRENASLLRRFGAAALRWRDWIVAKFTDASDWVSHKFDGLRADDPALARNATLLVAQGVLGEHAQDIWTIVTASNPEELDLSVRCLVDPRVSAQLSGRLSYLDPGLARVNAVEVEYPRLLATQPLSFGNLRLIFAGWLSLHRLTYVLVALTLATLLALTTRLFVSNVGRRS